jgi:predicted AAA+ superfamily ATPase
MAILARTLQLVLNKASKSFRVILVNGQRQVGKSTILKNERVALSRNAVSIPVWEA